MFRLSVFLALLVILAVGHGEKSFYQDFDISFEDFSLNLAEKEINYDILTLTQLWPQTACWNLNQKWTNNTNDCSPCNMPESKSDWSLHGLWPSSSNGAHPLYCGKTKFNLKLLNNALLSQMEEKWRSFDLRNNMKSFWKHEWDKHGTCGINLPSTNTLPKYFSKSIQLLDQYNIGKILAQANILPGKKYDYEEVLFTIEEILGVVVKIDCAPHVMSQESYINQIYLCFNTSFELIDCKKSRSRCKKQMWYPKPRQECGRI